VARKKNTGGHIIKLSCTAKQFSDLKKAAGLHGMEFSTYARLMACDCAKIDINKAKKQGYVQLRADI